MIKCKDCPVCNGIACKGQIPGVGGKGSGSTFIRNVEMLKQVKLNMNLIADDGPIDTSCQLFDQTFAMPIYVAPIAGIENNYGHPQSDLDYSQIMLEACIACNTIGFTGDGVNYMDYFVKPARVVDSLNGRGILTMKPWVSEGIQQRIEAIKDLNYFALAMDVDAAGLPLLRKSAIKTELKNVNKLKELKALINKPIIIKGIMTPQAALDCIEAGVDAIVISNHGGRVMDEGLSTIEVLTQIKEVCQNRITILIDGGFRTGYDVFKALALGADGVLIGRPFALSEVKNGKDGIVELYEKLHSELKDAMLMCGVKSLKEINANNVRKLT